MTETRDDPDISGPTVSFTLTTEDLSGEKPLQRASWITFEERSLPTLGGIRLMAKLGQGATGAVYLGIHSRLDHEVAVKVLHNSLVEERPDSIARFIREAKIAARIRSPHLVSVTDINQENDLHYIVMEFVRGKSASAYLRQVYEARGTGLSEAEALDVCIAATEGLAAAHAEGVIHRDIKPHNILIPQAKKADELLLPSAKLTDLGLARWTESEQTLTDSRASMGTPGYMPPEQIADAKRVDKSADVFSMGCTLYALLTGGAPFKGDTATERAVATLQAAHKPLGLAAPRTSMATSLLVERCLSNVPRRRYQNAQDLLEALKVCRAGSTATAAPASGIVHPASLVSARKAGLGQRASVVSRHPPPPRPADASIDAAWWEDYRGTFKTFAQVGGSLGLLLGLVHVPERLGGEDVELTVWLAWLVGSVLGGWLGGWGLGIAFAWTRRRSVNGR